MEKLRFLATTETSQELILDASEGETLGPSPMEAAFLAAGTCSATDVVHILGRMGQPLEDLQVELEAKRASESPRVLTTMHLKFRLRGKGLEKSAVERAIRLSKEKYCSVLLMLQRGGVQVSTSYEIA